MRFRLRVYPEDPDPNPGPGWEPVVFDGIYPLTAEPGDIYINRHPAEPLHYLFDRKGNCELVSREELNEWVTGGLMNRPGPVQPPVYQSKKQSKNSSGPVRL